MKLLGVGMIKRLGKNACNDPALLRDAQTLIGAKAFVSLLSAMTGRGALNVLFEGLLAIEHEQEQVIGNFESSRED